MFGVPVEYNFTLYYWKKGIKRDLEIETVSEYATFKHCCIYFRAEEMGSKLCVLL